jgi:putative Mg2+ transporter-C (MgtC) family protein
VDPIARLLGEWSAGMNTWSIILRIFLSFMFAGIIGYERARKRHAAGFRTFILVSLSSTMAMLLDVNLGQDGNPQFPILSAAMIIAIAIVSTNTILFTSKSQIKGLTTSVALLASGIIGLALGAGLYTISFVGFIFMLGCLSILPRIEIYLKNRSNHFEIHLELKNKNNLQDFVATSRKLGLFIDDIESNPAYANSGLSVYTISLSIYSKELKKYKKHSEIIEALNSLDYVNFIEEIK